MKLKALKGIERELTLALEEIRVKIAKKEAKKQLGESWEHGTPPPRPPWEVGMEYNNGYRAGVVDKGNKSVQATFSWHPSKEWLEGYKDATEGEPIMESILGTVFEPEPGSIVEAFKNKKFRKIASAMAIGACNLPGVKHAVKEAIKNEEKMAKKTPKCLVCNDSGSAYTGDGYIDCPNCTDV
jgi:hypothetical protein